MYFMCVNFFACINSLLSAAPLPKGRQQMGYYCMIIFYPILLFNATQVNTIKFICGNTAIGDQHIHDHFVSVFRHF